MKEYDWTKKMKPKEYDKVVEWAREEGFNKQEPVFDNLIPKLFKGDNKLACIIDALKSKFVDSQVGFIYCVVTIRHYNILPTNLADCITIKKSCTSLEEVKELYSKLNRLKELKKEFDV